MIKSLQQIAKDLFESQEKNNPWHGSKFEIFDKLKNDTSGKAGERFVKQICDETNISFSYEEDINAKDGTYDIIILDKKVEIKTARIGVENNFQHESLRCRGYDYIIFLDICPNYYYLSIVDINSFGNFKVRHPIFEIKPHLRKETTGTFKFDLRENTCLKKGIDKRVSIKVENEDPDKIKDFIIKSII
jgi:hypothetical protein